MYPGASKFFFVCRDDHLNDSQWQLEELIASFGVPHEIIAIKPHKFGPSHAVLAAEPFLNLSEEVIVNYADFACRWDYSLFLQDVSDRKLTASMPAYRGFHPHSGGETNYAYIAERDGLVLSVQEKKPFTNNKIQEYTSTGAYYFSSAELLFRYIRILLVSDLKVSGEFYLSGVFELMANDGIKSGVFEIEHFMQYVSLDSFGDQAEYIRHGLDFELLWDRVNQFLTG
jgi:bifunctional N-acetylglucosamine-1-phosphate-uridyltransferase/glucosamine-1-phosphate-acetyltransferase GlmU-like protein